MSKIGRNKPCPCGSGKKSKMCCGSDAVAAAMGPGLAEQYNDQGNSFADLGRLHEALGCYEKALEIEPDFAGAWNNLGIALKDLGQIDKAISCYWRALELAPSFAGAYNNLGNALKGKGKHEEALECYRNALTITPDSVQANINLGNILSNLGKHYEAIPCFQRALKFATDYSTYFELGNAFLATWNNDEAIACYEQALLLMPDSASTLNNLAIIHNRKGRLEEAISCYRKSLSANPDLAHAYCGMGSTLKDQCKLDEAVECYRKALAIKPDFAEAYSNLLLTLQYDFLITIEELFAEARQYASIFEEPLQRAWSVEDRISQPEGRLKVGLISADFRNHPVGYFLEVVLRHLSRDTLAMVAYSNDIMDDSLTERIRPCFEKWVTVAGMSDDQLADRIRSDGIDLLVDVSGHTQNNRLLTFARRPAPVQVSWLGYANTTGLDAMDFIIADPITLPPEEELFYTEKVWRLPETYVCFTPPNSDIPVTDLPALERGYIAFGCLNAPAKINETVISCWAEILCAVPDSVLHLKNKTFDHVPEREIFRQRFQACGIDPSRLRFAGASPRDEYLAAYREIDLCLDPFPFPGLTTTCEALWMGVPTLTLRLARGMYGHNGELVMKSVGLDDWVASSIEEYRERAIAFACNRDWLAALRTSLRQALLSSPLCAAERFARNLEDAFHGMVRMSTSTESVRIGKSQVLSHDFGKDEK